MDKMTWDHIARYFRIVFDDSWGCGNFNLSHLFGMGICWVSGCFLGRGTLGPDAWCMCGSSLRCVWGHLVMYRHPKETFEQWNGAVNEIWDRTNNSHLQFCAGSGEPPVLVLFSDSGPEAFAWAGSATRPPTALHGGNDFSSVAPGFAGMLAQDTYGLWTNGRGKPTNFAAGCDLLCRLLDPYSYETE
jgi:hypothetical protein